ncbi:ABC transporter permease [Halomarina pelagica]|uniref:ABC transporter permease n=1 Tax=Halomarina pelagica TaxID=2961599 RepID=UPI0020C43B87|nr:ABC transporter permease [Halomarina sp. BND7]
MSPTEGTGANAAQSDFETVAGTNLSRRERYRRSFEEVVVAPASIVMSDRRALFSAVIIAGYVLMGTVGVLLVPEPQPNQGPALLGAFYSLAHPLGTTYSGVDIFAQIVHATPSMLVMVLSGAVFSVALGTVLGTVSGYKGGTVDSVIMTFTDVAMTLPGLVLVIVLAGALREALTGNPAVIGVLLAINAWAGLARSIRSQVLTLRDAPYVEASRILGIPTRKIIAVDILPNLMPYVTMNFVQQARNVIFGSVALYFLGILPYSEANWGVMMDNAYSQAGAVSSPAAFHWLLMPMLAVIGLALALTMFAQAADRLFNPRVRARHLSRTATDEDVDDRSTDARSTGVVR